MPTPPFATLDPRPYALPGDFAKRFFTPALVIYMEQVRANLEWMRGALGGDFGRWRVHVKTAKIPAVFEEIALAGVRHFKAATTREVEQLLGALQRREVDDADVCLAYPLRTAGLARLGRLARGFPKARVSVLVEDEEALAQVPENVGVFIDLNSGMNRTGVPLADRARLERLVLGAGSRLHGLHFYDGHLHSGTDAERRAQAFAGYDRLLDLHSRLNLAGRRLELTTSGTPTFLHALAYPGFRELAATQHRVSPGTVVYHDLRSEEENPALHLGPAALVVAQIISHPAEGLVTCDAGSKSIAAEAGDPCAHVLGQPGYMAQVPNEEHLPLLVEAGPLPPRGTLVQLIPRHVCPTVNLAEEAVLIENGEVRGVVAVSARAHELRAD